VEIIPTIVDPSYLILKNCKFPYDWWQISHTLNAGGLTSSLVVLGNDGDEVGVHLVFDQPLGEFCHRL
jgi:hypothetical protein